MSGNSESFSHVSLHVSADWHVTCHHYTDQTPILNVDAGPATVSLSIKDRNADDSAVKFARALVREAQAFAAEVERLNAKRSTARPRLPRSRAASGRCSTTCSMPPRQVRAASCPLTR